MTYQPPDFAGLGSAMHALAAELFPITRSLTGPGYRETLDGLEAVSGSMQRHRVPTGEQVFDWTVPKEWTIRDAWIRAPDGELVCCLAEHNLHVVSYSVPVHARMTLEELQPRLHSLREQPDAIPYRTTYYLEDWGFCLTDRRRRELVPGEYEVLIDATLAPGHLELGEVTVPGTSDAEILFSTYCCHPSMANNELSGPLVTAYLAALVRTRQAPPRHTYRFLFLPETIGAIAYLAHFGERLRRRLAAGWVVTCVGDPGAFTYKCSRRGDALPDRITAHVLRHGGGPYSLVGFFPSGSDERQYCSPGFDLPVGSLMRTMYGCYPEYHTSLDNLKLITPQALAGSLQAYWRVVEALEANEVLVNTQPYCEPQLSKRGLYPTTGGGLGDERRLQDTMLVLNWCDGERDLLDVAERSERPIWALREVAEELLSHRLLQIPERGAEQLT
jgi:aminopeptidase-like protein